MTAGYRWVQWNRHKRVYDVTVAGACAGYLAVFVAVGSLTGDPAGRPDPPVQLMRALGTLGIVLLHIILCIGPAARLSDRAAPLLYNRRHLGVMFFMIVLLHALVAVGYYGGFGVRDPLSAVIAGYGTFGSVSGFPFEVLGFAALLIFFVMAATSHDFWLATLSPRTWKTLHMLVYVAYALVLLHVVLGPLQSEPSGLYSALLLAGAAAVVSLHVAAGVRELRRGAAPGGAPGEWVDAGAAEAFEDGAAVVVPLPDGRRAAVFRHGAKFSAVSNQCAHQGGPLGEGRILDGCITCPWHGYQYLPENGCSPPPFTEQLPTYEVRLQGRRVLVNPRANPPGTAVAPAELGGADRERRA